MPRLTYERIDLQIAIRRPRDARDGGVRVSVTSPGASANWTVPATAVADWLALEQASPLAPNPMAGLTDSSNWREPLADCTARTRAPGTTPTLQRRPRITLEIDDVALADLPWETALAWSLGQSHTPVVRVSPVRPRVQSILFTLPLRILQVHQFFLYPLPVMVRRAFGSLTDAEVA